MLDLTLVGWLELATGILVAIAAVLLRLRRASPHRWAAAPVLLWGAVTALLGGLLVLSWTPASGNLLWLVVLAPQALLVPILGAMVMRGVREEADDRPAPSSRARRRA